MCAKLSSISVQLVRWSLGGFFPDFFRLFIVRFTGCFAGDDFVSGRSYFSCVHIIAVAFAQSSRISNSTADTQGIVSTAPMASRPSRPLDQPTAPPVAVARSGGGLCGLKLATWNVQSLGNKFLDVAKTIVAHDLDISLSPSRGILLQLMFRC